VNKQTTYNPPLIEGKDDYTGDALTKRKDDTVEVFAQRLKSFHLQNQPLLDYYDPQFVVSGHHELRKRKKLVHFFGDSSDQIWPEMQRVIQQRVRLCVSLFVFFLPFLRGVVGMDG
jgi:adenylate kinase family enzyme